MRTAALASALALFGCSSKSPYQGDVVLGGFNFTADLVSDSCFDAGGSFQFAGVLSYDTHAQKLFLDTDGVPEDDHVGTLAGTHFSVTGAADRDFPCGTVDVVETIDGELFATAPDDGCDAFFAAADGGDGGLALVPDGGDAGALVITADDAGNSSFQPLLACGEIRDGATQVFAADGGALGGDGGPGCSTCEIVYRLTGTRQ